jgi:hypothetical protein
MFTWVSNGTIDTLIMSRSEDFSRSEIRSRTAAFKAGILPSVDMEPVLSSTRASSILFLPHATSPAVATLIVSTCMMAMIEVFTVALAVTRTVLSPFTTSIGPSVASLRLKFATNTPRARSAIRASLRPGASRAAVSAAASAAACKEARTALARE